jgi:uncharacterized membrane protein YtjA (UPF0391 family)
MEKETPFARALDLPVILVHSTIFEDSRRKGLSGRSRIGGRVFRWAFVFLIVTFLAGIFAFAGLVLAAAALAKLIFYLFLVLFLLALIAGLLRKLRSNIGE